MANLIGQTYFQKRLISIPQLSDAANLKRLTDYIEMHENDYLDDVLGYEMRKAFLDGIGDGDKWDNLLNGVEFTDLEGRLQKWTGFNNTIKESPIAYYVYFYKVKECNIILSTTGNVKTKNENSDRITGLVNLVDCWNYMVKYNLTLKSYLESNSTIYPEYDPIDTLTEKINYFGI